MTAVITLVVVASSGPEPVRASCSIGNPEGGAKASDGNNTVDTCTAAMRNHVKMEFEAALQYMLMGAHFAQDTFGLDGFAKMFFEHADEERSHGIQFVEYLRMRGDAVDNIGIETLVPILGKSRLKIRKNKFDSISKMVIVAGSTGRRR